MPTERGVKLRQAADDQISELIALLSEQDEGVLMLPCPGREKFGDGTVAALTSHTADNYLRISEFLQANRLTGSREGAERRHRTPRFLGAHLGHGPGLHTEGRPTDGRHGASSHGGHYAAGTVELPGLLERLSLGRNSLSLLADLTDEELDRVPPASGMRFCDGHRALEQVVTSLIKHQSHQVDAVKAALA